MIAPTSSFGATLRWKMALLQISAVNGTGTSSVGGSGAGTATRGPRPCARRERLQETRHAGLAARRILVDEPRDLGDEAPALGHRLDAERCANAAVPPGTGTSSDGASACVRDTRR